MGFLSVPKFASLINFQCQYNRCQSLNRHWSVLLDHTPFKLHPPEREDGERGGAIIRGRRFNNRGTAIIRGNRVFEVKQYNAEPPGFSRCKLRFQNLLNKELLRSLWSVLKNERKQTIQAIWVLKRAYDFTSAGFGVVFRSRVMIQKKIRAPTSLTTQNLIVVACLPLPSKNNRWEIFFWGEGGDCTQARLSLQTKTEQANHRSANKQIHFVNW